MTSRRRGAWVAGAVLLAFTGLCLGASLVAPFPPDAVDLTQEPRHIHDLYGTKPGQEHFANNCLLARRLIERGVRYVQLFDWGWDSHGASKEEALNIGFQDKCRDMDRATAALLTDLEQRGLLDETLVVWGGEFGRMPVSETFNTGGKPGGRDHNPKGFTYWLAGGDSLTMIASLVRI